MGTTTVNREGLDALTRQIRALKGIKVEFGIPSPSPPHLGKPGQPAREGLTAAQVLAWIEFGTNGPKPRAPAPKTPARTRAPKRRGLLARLSGGLRRFGRSFLRKIMSGFRSRARGGGGVPTPSDPPEPEQRARPARPIVRWVAQAKRGQMRALVRQVADAVVTGQDPEPRIERLRSALAEWTRNRIIDAGAVDTGQTRDAITAVVRRR